MPPSAHAHPVAQITDFPATLPPSSHAHVAADISDLPQTGDAPLYVLEGNGSGIMASASFSTDKSADFDTPIIAIMIVCARYAWQDGILLQRKDQAGQALWALGILNNNLYLDLWDGATTTRYIAGSDIEAETSAYCGIPVELGVQIDRSSNAITFFTNGCGDASQPGGAELMSYSGSETLELGVNLILDAYWCAIGKRAWRTPGTQHTPFPLDGRLALPIGCIAHYYVKDATSGFLPDVVGGRDMTVNCAIAPSTR